MMTFSSRFNMLALSRLSVGTHAVSRNVPAVTMVRFLSSKKQSSKKNKNAYTGQNQGSRDRALDIILRCLDAPKATEPPISEEERQRRHEIGRNYVIGRFEAHNELNHDLACKLVMKQHAIQMLPRDSKLREEALKVNYSTTESVTPLDRPLPTEDGPLVIGRFRGRKR
jgi:hypothetical protein